MRSSPGVLLPLLIWTAPACAQDRGSQPGPADGDDPRLAAIERYVSAYQRMAAFDGVVLIARGEEVVWSRAFGHADYRRMAPMTPDTRFRIASLSKQVTEAAIGRLVDGGAFELDASLSEVLPGFPEAERITIRQLVDHTAGIAHTNTLEWMDMTRPLSLEEIVQGLAGEPLLFTPGEGERYSNGGYALLAKVIESASGSSYGEFIEEEFARAGFPSLGHEDAFEVVPAMAHRYAPGPDYGERVEAQFYITANRIGGGSLYASAEDVWRFFRASYAGDLTGPGTTAALFGRPADGDVLITGRSPGALAQIYMDFEEELTVVTLSSNSAWPGSFNPDIVALYRGEEADLTPFSLNERPLSEAERERFTGDFFSEQFGWEVTVEPGEENLVFVQDRLRTAFAQTREGELHLPIYDWLCRYEDDGSAFQCRQRDPDAAIRFDFVRRP